MLCHFGIGKLLATFAVANLPACLPNGNIGLQFSTSSQRRGENHYAWLDLLSSKVQETDGIKLTKESLVFHGNLSTVYRCGMIVLLIPRAFFFLTSKSGLSSLRYHSDLLISRGHRVVFMATICTWFFITWWNMCTRILFSFLGCYPCMERR